jgi:hypothetical protein
MIKCAIGRTLKHSMYVRTVHDICSINVNTVTAVPYRGTF